MNRGALLLVLCLAVIFYGVGTLQADYTVVLKNGRRITVKGYREDGKMIKVQGMGGEFGIAKDQIESITKAGAKEEKGMVLPGYERPLRGFEVREQSREGRVPARAEEGTKEQKKETTEEDKEKEYQRKIRGITQELEVIADRYSLATRGKTGPEPGLLESKEAIRARSADLQSRQKDAQRAPSSRGGATPRVNVPLPPYSAKEKELSQMRKQMLQLRQEREKLIQEMKQKNFDTAVYPSAE